MHKCTVTPYFLVRGLQGSYERRLLFVWLINRIYNPWSLISFALHLILFLTGNLRAQNAVISFAIMVMLLSNIL